MKTSLWSMDAKYFLHLLLFISMNASLTSCKKDLYEKKDSVAKNNLSGSFKKNRPAASQPNVILILIDDMGYEVPSYSGGQSYETPSLDFMAYNGMQFSQCYCHPDGFPSRLAMYTGKYNFRNYVHWAVLPDGSKTIGNLMQDAGYATCFLGKWQCGGGDAKIISSGYSKYRAFDVIGDDQRVGRYKNPVIYENGQYLPDSLTNGRYSEDMFFDYFSNFVDSNITNPFFVVYASNLVAQPFVPSPDDPDYATWDPAFDQDNQDIKYFPGMVKYVDKKIGQIIQKVSDAGLAENTLIMFTADNATRSTITSDFKGYTISGQKTETTRPGTNISFAAYWPGTILPGQINNTDLIDFTDFLPTLADLAGTTITSDYGITDGVSFNDNLLGIPGVNRDWVFCHWDNNLNDYNLVPPQRFVNNKFYKLYGGSNYKRFFNIQKDIFEKKPLPDSALTPYEQRVKLSFEQVLQTEHN